MLKYLARYTHRVAISNHRLVAIADGRVTFRYQDYADDHRPKTMTLSADEFLRRFVQHVLPKGFVKVRHSGLLANRHRAVRLARCRWLLLVATAARLSADGAVRVAPAEPPCCPHCGGQRFVRQALAAERFPSAAPAVDRDTS